MKNLFTLFLFLSLAHLGFGQYYSLTIGGNLLAFDGNTKLGTYHYENDHLMVQSYLLDNQNLTWQDSLPYKIYTADNRLMQKVTTGLSEGIRFHTFLTWNDSASTDHVVHITTIRVDYSNQQIDYLGLDTIILTIQPNIFSSYIDSDTSLLMIIPGSNGLGMGAYFRMGANGLTQLSSPTMGMMWREDWYFRSNDTLTQWTMSDVGSNMSCAVAQSTLDGTGLFYQTYAKQGNETAPFRIHQKSGDTVHYFTYTDVVSDSLNLTLHVSNLRKQDFYTKSVKNGPILGYNPSLKSVVANNDKIYVQIQGQTSQYNHVVIYDNDLNEICREFVQFPGKEFALTTFLGEPYYVIVTPGSNVREYRRVSETCSIMGVEENSFERLDLILFPNPTADYFSLKGLKDTNNLEYEVLTVQGQLLRNGKIENNRISLEELPSSLYLVRIKQNGEQRIFEIQKY